MTEIQNKTILVVEDEPPLQDAVKMKLEASGYKVVQAFTAEAALDLLEKGSLPDFVWLDLLLPGMGGFQFLERVRANPKLQTLPVMVVSVSAGPEKIQQAFQLNVVDYVAMLLLIKR